VPASELPDELAELVLPPPVPPELELEVVVEPEELELDVVAGWPEEEEECEAVVWPPAPAPPVPPPPPHAAIADPTKITADARTATLRMLNIEKAPFKSPRKDDPMLYDVTASAGLSTIRRRAH
jgi:hypothetical protein